MIAGGNCAVLIMELKVCRIVGRCFQVGVSFHRSCAPKGCYLNVHLTDLKLFRMAVSI